MKNIREKALLWGMHMLALVLPLLYFGGRAFPYISSKTFFLYGTVGILVALWIYTIATDRSYRLTGKQWFAMSPFIIYIVWMSIAGIAGINPGLSVWSSLGRGTGLLTLYHLLGMCLVSISLANQYGFWVYVRRMLTLLTLSGFILILSVWFGDEGFGVQSSMFRNSSGGGLIGNSSLAAAYLMFVLCFSGVLLVSTDIAKRVRILAWTTVGLIIFSPLFINLQGLWNGRGILGSARGAFIALFVAVGISLFTYLALSSKKSSKVVGLSSIAVSGALFVVLWLKLLTPGTVIHEGFVKAASGTRFVYWDIAAKAMSERPLVGYGPENYASAVHRYFNPQLLGKDLAFEVWTDRAHNVFYDIGATGGYPAIGFYFLCSIGMVYGTYRAQRSSVFTRAQAAVIVGGITGYVFQNLFVFDGIVSLFGFVLLASMVYAAQDTQSKPSSGRVFGENTRYVLTILLIIGASLSWYSFAYLPSRKALLFGSIMGAPIDVRASRYSELLNGSPVGNAWDVGGFAHDIYKFYAKDAVSVKADTRVLPYAIKDVASFIAYAEHIAAKNPTDYRLRMSMIHLYSTQIYLSDMAYNESLANHMLALLAAAHALSPTDPQIYWAKGQIAAWKGDLQGVVDAYQEAIALDRTLVPAHTLLIGFLDGIGDQKGAQQALLQAQKDIPGFSMTK